MVRRLAEETLILATHNAGKLAEMRGLLAPYGKVLTSAGERGLPVPDETEDSFVGNARLKALAAMQATGLPALADDSGIMVDGLGGRPGVHTADWGGPTRDWPMAMRRVRDELVAAGVPEEDWTATFVSVLCLAFPDGHTEIFEGLMPGRLAWPPRGTEGHGYDPMFMPDGETRTYGEMTDAEKNYDAAGRPRSHRARSVAGFIAGALGEAP
jgi:XTP/dITP diphosphohydrolase